MALVSFPAVTPNDVTLGAINNTAQFVSPLSGHVQTLSRGGGRWRLRLGFRTLLGTDRGKLQGFIGALNGSANTFRVQDHSYVRQGSGAGTPLVDGASQTGYSLVTDGWPNNTAIFKSGDQLSYDNGTFSELKIVTEDCGSNGSGQATIKIWPEIHVSPANNASIVVATPLGEFRMLAPEASWTNRPGGSGAFSDFVIDAVEVLN